MLKTRSIALLGVVALLAILSIAACSKPTPTPTPKPTLTPTLTAIPTATPSPTPTATATPTPTPTPVPSVTREDARDLAILSTVALYPGITTVAWTENIISLPTVGTGEVEYTYKRWVVTLKYPIIPRPDYDVTLTNEELGIDWAGTVRQDGTVEGPDILNFFGLAPIMIIATTPSSMEGKIVTLVGEYRGWRSDSPPPETKSDWVLNDKTGEMYVTGASPDFDPVEDIGKYVTVTGIVKLADGIPYLKAVDVQEGFYEGPMAGPR